MSHMVKPIFITFEGIEGCGKSTQIKLLESYLKSKGVPTLLTREPGGTAIGEKIRQVLLNKDFKEMHPTTELLLYASARAQHVHQLILPALKGGKIVLCDRYADATKAYQGDARGIDKTLLKNIHKIATDNLQPVLTFLLDCPVEIGLGRAQDRNRFEEEKISFHKKVRKGYLKIAKAEPKRVKIIDATQTRDAVHQEIADYVEKYIGS
ncbi:MAG: dTMP kinase [Deltaproteobacteria bacterium RIFCSPLOWO2_02_FULL_46_8]|nr:MAG: dTMP kinase [Deltaproteobacteria bacterium RIFCSPLOWO2_02_FULL_46_8]